MRRRADGGPRLQQFAQALHGAGGALHLAPHFGERRGGAADETGVQQELEDLPARHGAGDDLAQTQPQHKGNAGKHQRYADGRERRAHAGAAHRSGEAIFNRVSVAFALQFFQSECLHGLDGVQRLPRQPAGIGDAVLRCARQRSARAGR